MTPIEQVREAAQALIDRWHTPNWKDAPHTGTFIAELERSLALLKTMEGEPARWMTMNEMKDSVGWHRGASLPEGVIFVSRSKAKDHHNWAYKVIVVNDNKARDQIGIGEVKLVEWPGIHPSPQSDTLTVEEAWPYLQHKEGCRARSFANSMMSHAPISQRTCTCGLDILRNRLTKTASK